MWVVFALAFAFATVVLIVLALENRELRRTSAETARWLLTVKLAEVDPTTARLSMVQRSVLEGEKAGVMRQLGEKQRTEIKARKAAVEKHEHATRRLTPVHSILQEKRNLADGTNKEAGRTGPSPVAGGSGPLAGAISG